MGEAVNQALGSEINSRFTSDVALPALEGQIRTVN